MKNKKIIILITIIIIAPILILFSIWNGNFSGPSRNVIGMIVFAIYLFTMIYSIGFIHRKKNGNNK